MSETSEKTPLIRRWLQNLGRARRAAGYGWRRFWIGVRNRLRRMRHTQVEYIVLPVDGPLPERDAPPRNFIERRLPLPPPPLSLETLNRRLQAIADADNVTGVVFIFRGFTTGLATLQNFRRGLQRLQAAGKRVVVYTPYLDLAHYYAASAADLIVAPPSTQFDVLGLRSEVTFLKDALDQLGIQVEVIQSAAHKTGGNTFSKSEITPEQQEQLDWLLDEQYDMITAAFAAGRKLSQERIKEIIDQAPHLPDAALEMGLIDHLAYEDDLPRLLAQNDTVEGETAVSDQDPRAQLLPWRQARRRLLEKPRRRSRQFIGVISLEGLITMGSSRQSPIDLPVPFLGGMVAGEQTLLRLLRRAEQIPDLAALIFHVDSSGGMSLAADLIMREVQRVAKEKPVIAYMGNVAASGGYYVSAPAQRIMSQSGTITGSIGVWAPRLNTSGFYEKLHLNRTTLQRGAHASLYSDEAPITPEQRALIQRSVLHNYNTFKQVVADGRDLPIDKLDPICEGRVWTGRQAVDHQLVDSHGDFVDAVQQAAALAGLPLDDENAVPVYNLHAGSNGHLIPQPFENGAEALAAIGRFYLEEQWQMFHGQPLALLPFRVHYR